MKITSQHLIFLLFVCGVFGDEVKKVSVMEGESVTLKSGLTEINTYRRIVWRFGNELIAEISEGKILYRDGPDGSFRDRLQLDSETASLNITNMRMKHSSLYELEAVSSTSGMMTTKKFSLSVYESPSAITVGEVEMKSVSVTEGYSLTLQTDVLHPRDELIVWRFGEEEKLIAKADLEAKNNSHVNIDERFRDRLKLNQQNGSLTINNMGKTDSGLYIVKISSSSKQTLHKKFIVAVTDPGLSPGAVAGIAVAVVVVLLMILAAAAGVVYRRFSNKNKQMSEKSKRLSEKTNQLLKSSTQLSEISEQLSEKSKQMSKICDENGSVDSQELDKLSDITEKLSKISGELNQLHPSKKRKRPVESSGKLWDITEELNVGEI